jgi:hypothetical protein
MGRKFTDSISVVRSSQVSPNFHAGSFTTPQLKEVHRFVPIVVAMCACNPDRSPVGINGRDVARTPTGFAEIVRDDHRPSHHLFALGISIEKVRDAGIVSF